MKKPTPNSLAYDVPGGMGLDCVARGPAKVDRAAMTASAILATNAIDRVGDRIRIPGIFTGNHKTNPVIYWDHGKDLTLPIGRAELDDGTYTIQVGESEVTQVTRFSQKLLAAEQIFWLIDERIISANSIGFRPMKAEPLYVNGRRQGLDILESELLEGSWVGVGCNPEAVREVLSRERVCERSLDEMLRKSLQPLASARPIWSNGADLYAIKSVDESVSPIEKALGEDAERLDAIADIVGGLLLRNKKALAAMVKDWRESDHPRGQPGNAGQFGPGGGRGGSSKPAGKPSKPAAKPSAKPAAKPAKKPASKPSAARAGSKAAQAAASKAISTILAGAITPTAHKELVSHLSALTVPQLHDLRKEHGLKASGKLKAQIIEKLATHFNTKVIREGTVDADKVANALKPFAGVQLDANTTRFAKADYLAIKQQYGTLAVHRIKEIAVDSLKALKELPSGSSERDFFKKKLAVCSWMVDQAKRDGITGKVEPANGHDFKANIDRIALAEKLKGTPWTAFLIKAIQHHFNVEDRSPEQVFHDLKAGKYTGDRLDAALKNVRADYGSMTQEQLFDKVLPKLKSRTDTVSGVLGGASSNSHRENASNVASKFTSSLNAAKSIPLDQRKQYASAAKSVLSAMPPIAMARVSQNLTDISWHADTKSIGETLAKKSTKIADAIRAGKEVGGAYQGKSKGLFLDGDSRQHSSADVYAHELSHAIDGPNYEISGSKEWQDAFVKEIATGKLSKYAATKASEGFAEFGRLVYGQRASREALAKQFPLCTAIWEKHGILPRSNKSTSTSVPEVFSERIAMPGGHADVLAKGAKKRASVITKSVKAAGSGRWITIGGKRGKDGERSGGSPVYIENGRITRGAPSLTGRKIDALKEKPEGFGVRQANAMERGHARAKWGKQARAEGIEPKHLHQLAAEIVEHDKESKSSLTRMLSQVKKQHPWLAGVVLNSRHGNDQHSIKPPAGEMGLDQIAQELAASKEFGHLFGRHEDDDGVRDDHSERLFDLLVNGAPESVDEDDAYEQAMEILRTYKQSDANLPDSDPNDEWKSLGKSAVRAR